VVFEQGLWGLNILLSTASKEEKIFEKQGWGSGKKRLLFKRESKCLDERKRLQFLLAYIFYVIKIKKVNFNKCYDWIKATVKIA